MHYLVVQKHRFENKVFYFDKQILIEMEQNVNHALRAAGTSKPNLQIEYYSIQFRIIVNSTIKKYVGIESGNI